MLRCAIIVGLLASSVDALRLPSPTRALSATASTRAPIDSSELLKSLEKRAAEIKNGAGRRYRVNNPHVGFLNVHLEPDDPFRTDNIVCQLGHGAVVTSEREDGSWVCHDGGGWSIREYDAHAYLVPIE